MRTTSRMVGGTGFHFQLEPTMLQCTASSDGARWEPLCRVIPAEMFIHKGRLLSRVVEKHGLAREGIHGFSFSAEDDYPGESARGVTIYYFEAELVASERFFAEFVLATASAHDELLRASGVTQAESHEAALALLQRKLSEGFFEP